MARSAGVPKRRHAAPSLEAAGLGANEMRVMLLQPYMPSKSAAAMRVGGRRRNPGSTGLSPHLKNLYIIPSNCWDGDMTTARLAIEILIAAGVLIVLWRVFFRRS